MKFHLDPYLMVFVGVVVCANYANTVAVNSRAVTNEDIRDAILSVVNMVRATEDKLERHEFRERALGEHIKKAFMMLDKRLKTLDPVKGTVSRMDERIAAVETILMQKDERERIQLQKTFDTVEDIQTNLPSIMEKLKTDLVEKISKIELPQSTGGLTKEDLDSFQKVLTGKIETISKTVSKIDSDIEKLKNDSKQVSDSTKNSTDSLERVKKQLTNSELLLEKYENKLAELNNRIPLQTDKKTDDLQTNILQVLENQQSNVEIILADVKSIGSKLEKLPNKEELALMENSTLDTLQELKYTAARQTEKTSTILDAKMKELVTDQDKKHEEVTKAISDLGEMHEGLTENFANSYEALRVEIAGLAKVENVMVQTADSVLDIKRRVEYGVHQILLEVGELIKVHGKDINNTIHERFDNFELNILDGESGALANLTSKIGQEIDQVWRQIGIMHQQMSASTDTLNKLQNQTDAYVNGSLSVMDSMKGKVGQITGRMSEVDDNLNYLMGKLGLVTQQFNQIKTGLGKALDEMRGTFMAVQDKIVKDQGPGPHNIAKSDESNEDNNDIVNSPPAPTK